MSKENLPKMSEPSEDVAEPEDDDVFITKVTKKQRL